MTRARDLADSADLAFDGDTLKVDSTNNRVGIGTSSPDEALQVAAAGKIKASRSDNARSLLLYTDNSAATVESDTDPLKLKSADRIAFETGGANERMRIDNSGNVGIGTSSPSALFHLHTGSSNHLRLSGTSGADYGAWASADGSSFRIGTWSTGARIQFTDSGDDFKVLTGTGNTTRLTVKSDGKVGIGTTSPSDEFQVTGSDPAIRLDDTSASGYARLEGLNGSLILQADEGNSVANSIVRFDVDGSERMRLDNTGHLLVNTTTDAGQLTVFDNAGSLGSSKINTAEFRRNDGTYNPRLQIRHSTEGSDINHTYSSGSDKLTLSNAGNKALTIDGSSNLHALKLYNGFDTTKYYDTNGSESSAVTSFSQTDFDSRGWWLVGIVGMHMPASNGKRYIHCKTDLISTGKMVNLRLEGYLYNAGTLSEDYGFYMYTGSTILNKHRVEKGSTTAGIYNVYKATGGELVILIDCGLTGYTSASARLYAQGQNVDDPALGKDFSITSITRSTATTAQY